MTEEARKLADELTEWKQAASVEAGLRREFQEAEAKLGAAYLRLRTLIPGAFDTPYAPTGEQVWETTEKALIAALRRSQPGTLAREEVARTPAFDAMIANLAALDKQRSPGPWKKTHDNITSSDRSLDARLVARCDTDWGGGWKHDPTKASKNARFITALENAWPKILAILAPTPSHEAGTQDHSAAFRSQVFQAAERTNKRYGQWMPTQWLEIFIGEMMVDPDNG